jgi:hypothetical protein
MEFLGRGELVCLFCVSFFFSREGEFRTVMGYVFMNP